MVVIMIRGEIICETVAKVILLKSWNQCIIFKQLFFIYIV